MFSTPDPKLVTDFAEKVRSHYPGGRHVADHVTEGPWEVLVVREDNSPNWLLEMALAASPTVELPVADPWSDGIELRQVYLMSTFVHEFANYWTVEDDFMPDHDLEFASYPEPLTDTDHVDLLVGLLTATDDPDGHVEQLTELVTLLGTDVVVRRLKAAKTAGGLHDRAKLVELTAAWHAAVTVGVTA